MENTIRTNDQADQVEALKAQIAELQNKLEAGTGSTTTPKDPGVPMGPESISSLPKNEAEAEAFIEKQVNTWLSKNRYSRQDAHLEKRWTAEYIRHLKAFFGAMELFNAPQMNSEAFPGAYANRRAGAELRARNALRDAATIAFKLKLGKHGVDPWNLAEKYDIKHVDMFQPWKDSPTGF